MQNDLIALLCLILNNLALKYRQMNTKIKNLLQKQ